MSKSNYFADDGWAVWIDGDDTSTVYMSDWLNPRGKSYIDVAIHIHGVGESYALNVYIPFPVSREELTDTSLLLHDTGILYAIFNAACIIDYQKSACTSELAYHGKTVDLVHISKLDYSMKPMAEGTLLRLSFAQLHQYLANDEAYFIFRLPHKSIDEIFKPKMNVQGCIDRLRECITTPVIAEKYGYSVRINEERILPVEVNRVGSFHRQKLKRAVVCLSINEEYVVNDHGCYRIRRLEEPLYRDYVPEGFSCENVITYQWDQTRERNLLGHFNFYFSIVRNSVSRVSMIMYLVLLLLIGITGSALWELIMMLIGK